MKTEDSVVDTLTHLCSTLPSWILRPLLQSILQNPDLIERCHCQMNTVKRENIARRIHYLYGCMCYRMMEIQRLFDLSHEARLTSKLFAFDRLL